MLVAQKWETLFKGGIKPLRAFESSDPTKSGTYLFSAGTYNVVLVGGGGNKSSGNSYHYYSDWYTWEGITVRNHDYDVLVYGGGSGSFVQAKFVLPKKMNLVLSIGQMAANTTLKREDKVFSLTAPKGATPNGGGTCTSTGDVSIITNLSGTSGSGASLGVLTFQNQYGQDYTNIWGTGPGGRTKTNGGSGDVNNVAGGAPSNSLYPYGHGQGIGTGVVSNTTGYIKIWKDQ